MGDAVDIRAQYGDTLTVPRLDYGIGDYHRNRLEKSRIRR